MTLTTIMPDETKSSPSMSLFRKNNNNGDDEPSPLSKLMRRIKVFFLAAQVFLSYKWVQYQEKRLRRRLGLPEESNDDDDSAEDHPAIVELWDAAHTENAQRLLRGIHDLQGFWIKVGQYLSSRADLVPRPYLQILASLQDGVPAKPYAEIQQTLAEQLGVAFSPDINNSKEESKQKQRLLLPENIDPTPLSTASLAQVHRARLCDGREVVLKVQHRGFASLMRQDMENFRTILQLLAWSEPDLDYNPIADEFSAEVEKELDFRVEAANMQDVGNLLREQGIRAIVPELVAPEQLVTEKVLVMEYCEGFVC